VFKPYKAFSKDCTIKIISSDIVSDDNDVRSTKASLVNRGIELLINVSDSGLDFVPKIPDFVHNLILAYNNFSDVNVSRQFLSNVTENDLKSLTFISNSIPRFTNDGIFLDYVDLQMV
jgi:hypothetical protein